MTSAVEPRVELINVNTGENAGQAPRTMPLTALSAEPELLVVSTQMNHLPSGVAWSGTALLAFQRQAYGTGLTKLVSLTWLLRSAQRAAYESIVPAVFRLPSSFDITSTSPFFHFALRANMQYIVAPSMASSYCHRNRNTLERPIRHLVNTASSLQLRPSFV